MEENKNFETENNSEKSEIESNNEEREIKVIKYFIDDRVFRVGENGQILEMIQSEELYSICEEICNQYFELDQDQEQERPNIVLFGDRTFGELVYVYDYIMFFGRAQVALIRDGIDFDEAYSVFVEHYEEEGYKILHAGISHYKIAPLDYKMKIMDLMEEKELKNLCLREILKEVDLDIQNESLYKIIKDNLISIVEK